MVKRKLSTKQLMKSTKKPPILNIGSDCLLKIFAFLDLQLGQANRLGQCCQSFNFLISSQPFTILLRPILMCCSMMKIKNLQLKLNNLTSLTLLNTHVSWEMLFIIGSIVNLKQFDLRHCDIDELVPDNQMFENKFPKLETFKLKFFNMNFGFLRFLGSTLEKLVISLLSSVLYIDLGQLLLDTHFLPSLKCIKLKHINDKTNMKWLSSCLNLVELDVECYSWKVLEAISSISKLEALRLADRGMGDQLDVGCLNQLSSLKKLSLQTPYVKNLCTLSNLNKLTTLELECIEDFQVPSFRNLTTMIISQCAQFQLPVSMDSLTSLNLRFSRITKANLKSVDAFSNLQSIVLFGAVCIDNSSTTKFGHLCNSTPIKDLLENLIKEIL